MNKTPPKPSRLFFDIETSPCLGTFWEPGYNITITDENIVKERAVICICWKWQGERKVHSLTWDKNQSDKKMLETFIPIMNSADEVVAHNCNNFDLPWIRTRALKHGISVVPDYTTIDTLKLARSRFKFNSNRLDYISKFLGVGQKIKTDYNLWKQVLLDNDQKALKRMVKYCENDVRVLEKVWNKMNPYVKSSSNFATHTNCCPECGSSNTKISKRRVTASGYRKVQYNCLDCGKYSTMAESRFLKGKKI